MTHCFTCFYWLFHVCAVTHHVCDMTHLRAWRVSFTFVRWQTRMECKAEVSGFAVCDLTHSYVGRDSFMFMPWFIHMCDGTRIECETEVSGLCMCDHDSFICVARLIHVYGMTLIICVPWLIHVWRDHNRGHSKSIRAWYVWPDSFVCGVWLIYLCAMTHSCVRCNYDSGHSKSIRAPNLCHGPFMCVAWLIHLFAMTYSCVWRDYSVTTMSRLLKITGLFCERAL